VTDVLLYPTPAGGEVVLAGTEPLYTDDVDTAVFLSLFGGQAGDDGTDATKSSQWWANWEEPDPSRRYRSATQGLLRRLPALPVYLRRVEDAVVADLQWMVASGAATSVAANARIPQPKKIQIRGTIVLSNGQTRVFEFVTDWA